jgi:hypothetical protein
MLQNFTAAVRELQRTFSDAFNPYRPELYYMRGPGPACRAKTTLATGEIVVLLVSHGRLWMERRNRAAAVIELVSLTRPLRRFNGGHVDG